MIDGALSSCECPAVRVCSPATMTSTCGRWTLLTLVLLVLMTGCGSKSTGRLAFSGKVLRNGKAVQSGFISFQPTDEHPGGPAANGSIHAGEYRFHTQNGPVPGPHVVIVNIAAAGDKRVVPEARTSEPTRWEFQVNVTEDKNFQKEFFLE